MGVIVFNDIRIQFLICIFQPFSIVFYFSKSTTTFIGSDQNSSHHYYTLMDSMFSNYAG